MTETPSGCRQPPTAVTGTLMAYAYHVNRSTENNEFYWTLRASNGEPVAWSGETYTTKPPCLSGRALFQAQAPTAATNDLTVAGARPRAGAHEFEVYLDEVGEYRWRFQANNNKIIATSGEGYTHKRDCLDGIALCKQNANARTVDHTVTVSV